MASLHRALRPAASARRHLLAPQTTLARRALASSPSKGPIHIDSDPGRELDVGELQGAKFRIEPLRRTGEDDHTMRARLLYQSRKRGILESDLLMSTFADSHLPTMNKAQMQQYDLFLDENDWDIYYWATQDESPGPDTTPTRRGPAEDVPVGTRKEGEWAQTVGTFKPAYRPVPARWKDSEVLEMLRAHVRSRRADPKAGGQQAPAGDEKGMGFMPPLFEMKRSQ